MCVTQGCGRRVVSRELACTAVSHGQVGCSAATVGLQGAGWICSNWSCMQLMVGCWQQSTCRALIVKLAC